MANLNELGANDVQTNQRALWSMFELTLLMFIGLSVITLLIYVFSVYPKHQNIFWPALTFYLGFLLCIPFSRRFTQYRIKFKNPNKIIEVLESDALYVYSKKSKVIRDSQFQENIKLWKFEFDEKEKNNLMRAILKELDGTNFYSHGKKEREDALSFEELSGLLLHYILRHTEYKPSELDSSQTDDGKNTLQKVLLDRIMKHYKLKPSRLSKEFAKANSAFKAFKKINCPSR